MVIVIRLAVDGDYLFAHCILYQKLMVMSSVLSHQIGSILNLY
jgi:hypothetical protein